MSDVGDVRVRDLIEPLCQLQHTDANVAYKLMNRLRSATKVSSWLSTMISAFLGSLSPLPKRNETNVAYKLWTTIFPLFWSTLSTKDCIDLEKDMVTLCDESLQLVVDHDIGLPRIFIAAAEEE
jgi:transformation/transcription domain-associated protein